MATFSASPQKVIGAAYQAIIGVTAAGSSMRRSSRRYALHEAPYRLGIESVEDARREEGEDVRGGLGA
jgi:hypothetical protein